MAFGGVFRRYPAATVSALSGSALLLVVHRHFGATFENPTQLFLDHYATSTDLLRPPIRTGLLVLLGVSVAAGLLSFGARTVLADGFRGRHALVVAAGYAITPGALVFGANAAVGLEVFARATVEGSVGGALVGSFVLLAYLIFGCLFGVAAAAAAVPGGIVAGVVPLALDRARRSRRHRA